MLLTELDVDLRPRRPLEPRRKAERGVSGDGERECRLFEVPVYMRGGGGYDCVPFIIEGRAWEFAMVGRAGV
jgi:hypothetical protein